MSLRTRFTQKFEDWARRRRAVLRVCEGYYIQSVQAEMQLAGINQQDRVLMIGGGPCPMTAVLIRRAGTAVTVADICSHCVEMARAFLARNSSDVAVQHSCGGAVDPSGFSVVIIAKQVQPWKKVLSHVLEQADAGTRILVRQKHTRRCTRPHVHHGLGTTTVYVA